MPVRRDSDQRPVRVPGLAEYVEQVPWGEYRHAYGEASDVPALLLGLADDDSREEALYELFGNIWHQGTVYGASAPAAPALAMVAGTAGLPQRDVVLALMAAIASGSSYVEADQSAAGEGETRPVPAARQAVIETLPSLRVALVEDPDLAVRRALPHLLAVCDDRDARPLLRGRLRTEPDATVRASLALALSVLGEGSIGDGGEPGLELAVAVGAGDAAGVVDALDGLPVLDALGNWTEGEVVRFILERFGPADQVEVITAILGREAPELRQAALHAATELACGWRSPAAAVVELLGRCLRDPDQDVAEVAAHGLADLSPASRPAADALLAAATPTASRALARLRDTRVLPLLGDALAEPDPPRWTGEALTALGALASEHRARVITLVASLRDRSRPAAARARRAGRLRHPETHALA